MGYHNSEMKQNKLSLSGMQRKYMTVGLSQTFRQQLEAAIRTDAPIINVITWNDYPEGHHLAPEVNHNFGFSILLTYYKSVWQGKPNPYQEQRCSDRVL